MTSKEIVLVIVSAIIGGLLAPVIVNWFNKKKK
jgi:H+/Cl- antiporter ClcA